MTDADLGKLVNAAFDAAGFAETIRERLRSAVADAIGDGEDDADVRASRVATDALAALLVAQGRKVGHARALRAAGRRADEHRSNATHEVELRATAFRAMAGVRV
jgi:hypothetical protein